MVRALTAPVSITSIVHGIKPMYGKGPLGGLLLSNQEVIASCQNGGYPIPSTNTWYLNPGLSTFPWLSSVAKAFTKYRFHKLILKFRTYSSTSTATDWVNIFFEPDVNAVEPSSIELMQSNANAVGAACWQNFDLNCDLSATRFPQYIIRSGVPTDALGNQIEDFTDYDIGYCGCVGTGTASAYIGFLLVSYEVELFMPRLQAGVSATADAISRNYEGGATLSAPSLFDSYGRTTTGQPPATVTYDTVSSSWKFVMPWEGILDIAYLGTGLLAGSLVPSFLAGMTYTLVTAIAATTGLYFVHRYYVRARAGDYMKVTPAADGHTVTETLTSFSAFDYGSCSPWV